MCSSFAESLSWGTSFIANEEAFAVIEKAALDFINPAGKLQYLQTTIEKHQEDVTTGLQAVKSAVEEMQMQMQKSDYLDMVNIAKESPDPAPFSSIQSAERYLSASPENMDILKTLFGNSQTVLSALQRNKKYKEANNNRNPPLQSRIVWDFLFTKSVLASLSSKEMFE